MNATSLQGRLAGQAGTPRAAPPRGRGTGRRAAAPPRAGRQEKHKEEVLSGVMFNPFEEVAPVLKGTATKGELNSPEPEHSFARVHYSTEMEAAVNEQINVELNMSYLYQAMSSYFDRHADNVSLPGLASYFRSSSDDERSHAQKLIDFQNTRGGRVKFASLISPVSEFYQEEKGDALYAMVADNSGDPQMTQFIEDMLDEQVQDVKKSADYVAQLRRVGKVSWAAGVHGPDEGRVGLGKAAAQTAAAGVLGGACARRGRR
eukprot:scaffold28.g7592.t1